MKFFFNTIANYILDLFTVFLVIYYPESIKNVLSFINLFPYPIIFEGVIHNGLTSLQSLLPIKYL